MAVILFADDEEPLRRAVRRWLGRRGHEVHTARSVASARRCFTLHRLEAAVLDVWLPDGSGVELLAWMREHHPSVAARTAFVTGDILDGPVADRRLASLGLPVLEKPFELGALDRLVERWFGTGGARGEPVDAAAPPPADGR
jgi:two-component system response regulator PilR (NtrC family)